MKKTRWETVESTSEALAADFLERIAVPGGWLYRTICLRSDDDNDEPTQLAVAMVYVPDPDNGDWTDVDKLE